MTAKPSWVDVLEACPLAQGPFLPQLGRCDWCGRRRGPRRRRWCSDRCADAFGENHVWSVAREAAKKRDNWTCVRPDCGRRRMAGLEVNHVVPILGRHAEVGCHHHLDGLETLCHDHHLITTAEQFGRDPSPEVLARAMGTRPLFDYPDAL